MIVKEMREFEAIRTRARAYLCYVLGRNIEIVDASSSSEIHMDAQVKRIRGALPHSKEIYVIDGSGVLIGREKMNKDFNRDQREDDKRSKSYYYKTIEEHRCTLTDPYPSLGTNEMVVTASFPVYDENNSLMSILCVDILLEDILKMFQPGSIDSTFGKFSKVVYASFSVALFAVALLLFVKGISSFLMVGFHFSEIDINEMFKSTILLTLSLAIFDLVKAIFEEEVLGKEKKHSSSDGHQTMIRFLGSIIIALSIESLMLVFKFALTDPSRLVFAVYLIGGVTALMIGLSIYIKANKK